MGPFRIVAITASVKVTGGSGLNGSISALARWCQIRSRSFSYASALDEVLICFLGNDLFDEVIQQFG